MGTSSFLLKLALPLLGLVVLTKASGNSTSWTSTTVPTSSSSSLSSTTPTATSLSGLLQNPKTIGLFNYGGCIRSPDNFPTFSKAASSNLMSNELCVSACVGHAYSAAFGPDCYCADTLDPSVIVAWANTTCTTACPGNIGQACGGKIPALPHHKREDSIEIVNIVAVSLSLYIDLEFAAEPPCDCDDDDDDNWRRPPPPPPTIYLEGDIIVTVSNLIYVDICDTCPGGLAYYPTTTTLTTTACGCDSEPTPTWPMTVTTKTCGCGPGGSPSTVVLTLPVTATTPCPTLATGYVPSNGSYTVTTGSRASPRPTPLVLVAGADRMRWAWRGTGAVVLGGVLAGL